LTNKQIYVIISTMKNELQKPYHHGDHIVYSCQYHIVFCPKYRRKVLVNGIDARLKELFPQIAKDLGGSVLEMEVMPDHVHLLVDIDPRLGIDDFVGSLKRRSSHAIRVEFPYMKSKLPSLWTRGKFIATVGSVSLETVKQYIEDQKGV
jgi:putative transposase